MKDEQYKIWVSIPFDNKWVLYRNEVNQELITNSKQVEALERLRDLVKKRALDSHLSKHDRFTVDTDKGFTTFGEITSIAFFENSEGEGVNITLELWE